MNQIKTSSSFNKLFLNVLDLINRQKHYAGVPTSEIKRTVTIIRIGSKAITIIMIIAKKHIPATEQYQ